MNTTLKTLKYAAIGLVSAYVSITLGGLLVKRRGQSAIDEDAVEKDGAKLVKNKQGRWVEYFTYGSTKPDAPVIINMHGSGLEAGFERAIYQPICEQLNVRGIAISLPGFGNTDTKIGRVVADWPAEDLEPVLQREGVGEFMITGHSQGNPHAMAAAYHFGERCTGLGLYAPLLPNDVTDEIGIIGALGTDGLLTTNQLKSPFLGGYFAVMYLTTDLFAPSLPVLFITQTTPKLAKETVLIDRLKKTLVRATRRGAAGNAWESTKDVCYDWGFDPRLINTRNICVWHAEDDTLCPPQTGAWLAGYYAQKGATVNFKHENEGYGHFTYSRGQYIEPKHSLVKALLDGRA